MMRMKSKYILLFNALLIYKAINCIGSAYGTYVEKKDNQMIEATEEAEESYKPDVVRNSLITTLFPYPALLDSHGYLQQDQEQEYRKDQEIPMMVQYVESQRYIVPYEYNKLSACQSFPSVSNGQAQGQRAPYQISVLEDKGCTSVCKVRLSTKDLSWMRKLVDGNYRIHYTLDKLPVNIVNENKVIGHQIGYPVGFKAPPEFMSQYEAYYLYNHLRFTILYSRSPESENNNYRVVGFHVYPVSINHKEKKVDEGDSTSKNPNEIRLSTCSSGESIINIPSYFQPLKLLNETNDDGLDIHYSYEVKWKESFELKWSNRWDVYTAASPSCRVQLKSIINSVMIVVFLAIGISVTMLRKLKTDLINDDSLGNETSDPESQPLLIQKSQEKWKLLHGDVFRPPEHHTELLCVTVGTGLQICSAVYMTLFFIFLGFVNPKKQRDMCKIFIILFVGSGIVNGYVSSRLYKYFNIRHNSNRHNGLQRSEKEQWGRFTLMTSSFFPAIFSLLVSILNIFLNIAGAANAISLWKIPTYFIMWTIGTAPFGIVGIYLGARSPRLQVPTKIIYTSTERPIPPKTPSYTQIENSMILGGAMPFICISIEYFFIMSALWLGQIYYTSSFLLFHIVILTLVCGQSAIILNYLLLSAENHKWWWRSFANTASSGVYLLIYGIWFFLKKMHWDGDMLSIIIYLLEMFMINLVFGLACGSIGFVSCFLFNKIIFGALRVD